MAAAVSGAFPVCLDQQRASAEEEEMKKKQMALMEKLRNKRTSQHRSWTDSLMKSVRTTGGDRRLQADGSERVQVQKCLDTLQRAMKVISQQSLVERLDLIARQQGLSFHYNDNDPSVKLQADMFHIEIILNKGGGVKEVKIAHQGDASVCHELTEILGRGDFPEFTSHLEGLQSIYQVTAEKKLKSKAFLALQSLEKDLNSVAQFQTSISGVANYIHKSPLGILLPRTAGKPMKLIYFVSPYDLLDKTTNSAHPMTVEAITEHGLGRSVTVCLEPGPPIKLQTMPLVSFNKTSDGNCLPSFTGLSQGNSALLPAHFVLVLSQPVPIALSLIHKFQTITGLDTAKEMGTQPLLSLILDSNSGGKMRKDQQLYVTLPGQNQLYFINGVSGGPLNEPGVMLSRIPFSHPTHVPKILSLLRQQLLFNSILTSCVRPSAKKDPTTNLVFEMTVISLTQMMIVFEHPACDTIVTVDIDMSDITSLKCSLQCSNTEHSICTDDFASRVLQRCLSLPILMRSLVLQGQVQLEKLMAEARAQAEEQAKRAREMALFAAAQARQQQQARLAPTVPTKGRPPPPQPPPPHLTPSYPPTPSPVTSNPPSVGAMGDLRAMGGVDLLGSSPPGYPQMDSQDKQNNPLLVTLLDGERVLTASPGAAAAAAQGQGGTMPITESPMLSRLLDDNISVATSITPIITPSPGQAPPKPKGTKGRKRRSQSDMAAGRSPKRLISDSDNSERYGSVDLESSSSPFESSLGGSGSLAGFHHQMVQGQGRPPSQGHMSSSSVIDLTDEHMPNESSLKKLFDMKPGGATPDSELQALLSRQEHSNSPSAGLKPNQVTGPKNENASTSPEGLLIGSGEVGKASLPDPLAVHHHKVHAHAAHAAHTTTISPPTTLAAFLGHGPTAAKARRDSDAAGLHAQPGGGAFLHQELKPVPHFHMAGGVGAGMAAAATPVAAPLTSSRPKVVSSGSMTELLDVKPVLPPGKKGGGLKASASMDPGMDKRGLFEKFDFTGQTASTAHITITSSSVTASSGGGDGEDVPKVRLKLQNFRAPHSKSQSLDSGVVQSPSSAGSKSSNSNTFDFHSDEDDDEPMPINMNYHVAPERLAVYSSSPTRLQISSKGKPPTPVSTPESSPSVKPEKYKRKDKSSGNAKRKKDRDESKKERKKKKLDRDLYQPTGKELTYRASTVETDQKTGTKLKIRVSKELLAKVSSPVKESSRVDLNSEKVGKFSERLNDAIKRRPTPSSPTLEKLILHKQDIKDVHTAAEEANRDRDLAQLYRSSPTGPGRPPKSGSSGKSGTSGSNSALGKADPKLAKATIRLKPLNITSTTSTSVTLSQPTKTTSSSRSVSDRSERRNQSASTPVTTPTSSTLTLSSILPDAPTASSVASLPKIPKVSSQNSNAAATTTTASVSAGGTKPSPALANNSVKNSAINSTFNNSLNKGSGSPGMGAGRSGSNPNIPNATKSPNMGFNKSAGAGGMQKSSPNMPGHKPPGTTTMPPGILKNCGNVSQGGSNGQKTQASGNQGLQKGPGGANQLTGPYNRGPNSSNQTGGSQKSVGPGQGLAKNMPNQVGGAYKTGGVQGGVSRGPNAGAQGLQKGPGGLQKSPNVHNQAASTKLSGSPNHNVGPQKAGVQGKSGGGSPVTGSNKTLAQGANQKNSAQGGNFTSKPQGSATTSQGQVQKLLGNQGRSMSTSSYNSSPNSSGRPGGMVRNNSVAGSGGGGGGRTPPNHLPVNRSASASGQKAGSGSSPRTPAGHSPSNPSAPRFPSNSPGQKNSGASPSSVSQRSGSTPQTSSQRSTSGSNSSQHGANPRSSGVSSQRSSTSPQTPRSAPINPGSSPNQRPASTPGPGSDPRLSSNGPSHSPGYPVRPSSAGPRQTSSPLGSSPLTSNSSGTRTASPSSQGPRGSGGGGGGGGSGTGVSSLASGQSATGGGGGGATDKVPLSRQNSRGSLLSPAVSRQNSTASLNPPVVSRQNSSGSANPPVVSKQNSSGSLTAAVSRQNSSGGGKTAAVSRQNSASSLNPAAVSKHDAAGAGSRVSVSASRQSSTAGSSVATVSKQKAAGSLHTTSVSQHNSSVSSSALAASRQNSSGSFGTKHNSNGGGGSSSSVSSASRQTASSTTGSTATSRLASSTTMTQASTQSGTVHTSGKPISTSSTTSPSTVLSAAKTSNTGTHNTQRTSSSGVSTGSLASANKTGVSGNKTVTSKAAGAGGVKTSSGGGVGESSGAVTSKGASSAKANTTTTASVNVKSSAATSVTLSSSVSTTSSVATSKGGASSATSAVHAGTSSVTASSAAGLKVQNSVSSSSASCSSAATSTSASTSPSSSSAPSAASSAVNAAKAMVAGAARGRKGSLSAIVNKLATKMVAASGAEGGETGEGVTKAAEGLMEVQEEMAEVKAGVKRSASVSGLSPPSGELKIQRMEAHSKAAPGTPTTPTTLTPAHTTPPHTSSLPLAGVERRRSGSVGEQSRELGEVGLDLSLPKDKAKPEAPLAPSRPDSRGRVSPKDSNPARSGSPAIGAEKIGGMKFNGDSSKDKSRSENEVFKVPTPKTTEESEERGSGGGGSGGVGSKFGRTSPVCNAVSRSLPAPGSPLSDASSPENELVIDCEESPSLTNNRPSSASGKAPVTLAPVYPSPKRVSELASESPAAAGRTSPGLASSKSSPTPSARKNSPQLSPHPKPSPSPAPNDTGANSPCEIDDDLMDAALMGFNAS